MPDLFANRPERCPYGHLLAIGQPQQVSWQPCRCQYALAAAAEGGAMGHLLIQCGTCEQEHRKTVFHEPPHDPEYRDPRPWQPPR